MAIVWIPLARPTRRYSPLQEPLTTDNANCRHLSPAYGGVFSNADFAFAIGNFSYRRTYTCDTPRLGAMSMADDEGIQTLLDGGKVKSYKRGKSKPLC